MNRTKLAWARAPTHVASDGPAPSHVASDKPDETRLGTGPRAAELEPRATELLCAVGLEQRLHHPPARLSVGEQQRVAIARALLFEPVLLLGDEPTGELDSATGAQVIALLREQAASRGTALVIATHERLWSRAHRAHTGGRTVSRPLARAR